MTLSVQLLQSDVRYLTHLNFRSPLIFAQICAKINGSENRTHISYLKINGSTQIRSRINVYDTGCAKINGAKIRVSENWWCAKFKVSKVYIYICFQERGAHIVDLSKMTQVVRRFDLYLILNKMKHGLLLYTLKI